MQKRVERCFWQPKKKNKFWDKSEPMIKFSAKLEEEEEEEEEEERRGTRTRGKTKETQNN